MSEKVTMEQLVNMLQRESVIFIVQNKDGQFFVRKNRTGIDNFEVSPEQVIQALTNFKNVAVLNYSMLTEYTPKYPVVDSSNATEVFAEIEKLEKEGKAYFPSSYEPCNKNKDGEVGERKTYQELLQ